MKRVILAIPACVLFLVGSVAIAQEPAKTKVTIKIADKTPSFKDHRLVVMLYHDNPQQRDRGKVSVDRHIDAKFSHQQGKETVLTLTLGEKAKINPSMQYSVTVQVFEAAKRTHVGEVSGSRGPFFVLTNGTPNQIAVTIRPES